MSEQGKSENELTFKKGDIFEVYEKLDKGWWKGKVAGKDKIGFFPGNYVIEKPLETDSVKKEAKEWDELQK